MPLQQKEFTHAPPHPPPGSVPSTQPGTDNTDGSAAWAWYSLGPGIWELLLNGDTESMEKSVLQWYEPGAVSVTDEVITHEYIEEVVFLEGGLEDLSLRQAWSKGAYAYRYPGMRHGPYRASDQGCLQFVKIVPPREGE